MGLQGFLTIELKCQESKNQESETGYQAHGGTPAWVALSSHTCLRIFLAAGSVEGLVVTAQPSSTSILRLVVVEATWREVRRILGKVTQLPRL